MEPGESKLPLVLCSPHSDSSPQGLYLFNRYVPLVLLLIHTIIYLNTDLSDSM